MRKVAKIFLRSVFDAEIRMTYERAAVIQMREAHWLIVSFSCPKPPGSTSLSFGFDELQVKFF